MADWLENRGLGPIKKNIEDMVKFSPYLRALPPMGVDCWSVAVRVANAFARATHQCELPVDKGACISHFSAQEVSGKVRVRVSTPPFPLSHSSLSSPEP